MKPVAPQIKRPVPHMKPAGKGVQSRLTRGLVRLVQSPFSSSARHQMRFDSIDSGFPPSVASLPAPPRWRRPHNAAHRLDPITIRV